MQSGHIESYQHIDTYLGFLQTGEDESEEEIHNVEATDGKGDEVEVNIYVGLVAWLILHLQIHSTHCSQAANSVGPNCLGLSKLLIGLVFTRVRTTGMITIMNYCGSLFKPVQDESYKIKKNNFIGLVSPKVIVHSKLLLNRHNY